MNRNRPYHDTICLLAGMPLSSSSRTRHTFRDALDDYVADTLPLTGVGHPRQLGKLWLMLFRGITILLFAWCVLV